MQDRDPKHSDIWSSLWEVVRMSGLKKHKWSKRLQIVILHPVKDGNDVILKSTYEKQYTTKNCKTARVSRKRYKK